MNIHFTSIELFDTLNFNSTAAFNIGSHMYNLNNQLSDIDWLNIYIENEQNRNSFLWEHHQLQYKYKNIDFNFVTLQTFIRNCLTGDSTINFECIWSDQLLNTELKWLKEFRYDFINYNIIKSYLGFAKRDLRFWRRDSYNGKKNNIKTNKKLSHFFRGIIFANMLYNNYFTFDLENEKLFKDYSTNDKELLKNIKNEQFDNSYFKTIEFAEKLMNELRNNLNDKLNNKKISFFMKVDKMKELDQQVIEFIKNFKSNNKILNINYGDIFYNVIENGIKY